MIVLIGVCTYKRPQMLRDCLDSLTQQLVPPNISAAIVVVDNESDPAAETIVDEFYQISPIPIYYVHEPRRGIACARNAVIGKAMSLRADHIAFIDDDETAEPDWIANLMVPEYLEVPVLMGWQRLTYPESLPFWTVQRKETCPREGRSLKTASTNNVRFSSALVRAGLRFDETLGLMGGEDNEFFAAAGRAGFAIRQTARAVTHETAHMQRLTYRAQMYRMYWCALSDMRMDAARKDWIWVLTRKGHTIPSSLAFGVLELLVSPFFLAAGMTAFKKRVIAGGKKIAKAVGRTAGLLGFLAQPYRKTVGY